MAKVKSSAVSFRTQYDVHPRVSKVSGEKMRKLYTSHVTDDGVIELIESGQEDLYAAIQSHRDSCDINVILARYANGDAMALSKVQGVYGDFTDMPDTYAELLNTVIKGENFFYSLPKEVREKFDHSFEKFLVSMDDHKNFIEIMDSAYKDLHPDAGDNQFSGTSSLVTDSNTAGAAGVSSGGVSNDA